MHVLRLSVTNFVVLLNIFPYIILNYEIYLDPYVNVMDDNRALNNMTMLLKCFIDFGKRLLDTRNWRPRACSSELLICNKGANCMQF